MIRFLLKRIVTGVAILWGIVTVLFFLFTNPRLGDPAKMVRGQRSDMQTDDAITKMLYLDRPFYVQYLLYLNDLSPLSLLSESNPNIKSYSYLKLIPVSGTRFIALKSPYLRRSFQTNREVGSMVMEKLPGSFILAVSSMLFATLIGIFLGVVSSLSPGSFLDRSISFITLLGISVPSFFAGVVILWIFAVYFGDYTHLPVTGYIFEESPFGSVTRWSTLLLPTLALGIRPLAIITQLTRSSMMDMDSMDFVRTAKAKGLSRIKVLFFHTLRNALNPVVTSISGWFASLLAGAFFIEYIFGWQGIGNLTIDALGKNDHPLVLGCAIWIGLIFVVVNLLVDVIYARLDPRIRLNG